MISANWLTVALGVPLYRNLVRNADIQNGAYDIHWLEKFLAAGGDGAQA